MEPSHKVYIDSVSKETQTNSSKCGRFSPPFLSVSSPYSESLFVLVFALSLYQASVLPCFPLCHPVPKLFMPMCVVWVERERQTKRRRGIEFSLAASCCFCPPNVDSATVQSSHGLFHLSPPSSRGPSYFGVFETGQLALRITVLSLVTKRSSFLGCSVLLLVKSFFFPQTVRESFGRGGAWGRTVRL